MKKVFVSLFAMALMVTGSMLSAQETESAVEAKAAEAVEAAAVVASSPVEEIAPVAVDAQGSVSDGVAVEEALIPMAAPDISGVTWAPATTGVVLSGGCSGCAQPVQAFAPVTSCGSCCGQSSFVQPVVYNQPIFANQDVTSVGAVATSVVSPAPVPAQVYSQPVTSGCSSCSGGGVVNFAPAASYPSTPVATSYAPVEASYAPVDSSYASVDSSYAPAPVATSGCSSCGTPAVSYSSPCCSSSSNACCQSSGRNRSGLSSRFRRILIGRAIDESR